MVFNRSSIERLLVYVLIFVVICLFYLSASEKNVEHVIHFKDIALPVATGILGFLTGNDSEEKIDKNDTQDSNDFDSTYPSFDNENAIFSADDDFLTCNQQLDSIKEMFQRSEKERERICIEYNVDFYPIVPKI
jgi:hypothetical protein